MLVALYEWVQGGGNAAEFISTLHPSAPERAEAEPEWGAAVRPDVLVSV